MPKKFEVHIEAERLIHNDLKGCASWFQDAMREKFETGATAGVYYDMLGSLIFCSFAIEAKVNFVGWKVLGDGWPERASLREKIDLLIATFGLSLTWGAEPLQSISKLKRFRDTIAHGKPDPIEERKIVEVKPEIWEALKGQWESAVNSVFVEQCHASMDELWGTLLEVAEIDEVTTTTRGTQSFRSLIEGTPDPE